jgi:hypothetical protein
MKVGHKQELIQQLLKHLYFEYNITIHPPAVTIDEINDYEEALSAQLEEEEKLKAEEEAKLKEIEAARLTDKDGNKLIEIIDEDGNVTLTIDTNIDNIDKDVNLLINDRPNSRKKKNKFPVNNSIILNDALLECPEISSENDESIDNGGNIDDNPLGIKPTEEVVDEKQVRIEYVRELLTQPTINQETIHLDRPNIPQDLRDLPQTVC